MREDGIWWVKPPTLASKLVAVGSPFVFPLLVPMLGDQRKRTPLNVPSPWLNEPSLHRLDGMSLVVLAGGLVVLGLIGASSRWLTRRTGRQPTSLNGWVTWTTMVGSVGTIMGSGVLFPHQSTYAFALTWLFASGVWFLTGQLLFGAKTAEESLLS